MSELGHVDTVVIGAGHAGLAMSRLLTDAGREHVVLDRGRIGERWRTERWDSLHLLTPNWMTRLPGWPYAGPDPDGFRSASELVGTLEKYAASFAAPVVEGAAVRSVRQAGLQQYDVATDCGTFRARHVVVASGPHATPIVPDALRATGEVEIRTSNDYRNPDQLPAGGVLVVGASSSGVQIADELSRAGRDVVLAVGRHSRMPRRYRGMDAFWWLEQTGRTGRTIDEVSDAAAARAEPSLQLVGRPRAGTAPDDLDLAVLRAGGVRLTGRLESLSGTTATFSEDLPQLVAAADRQMHRFLDVVDDHIDRVGLTAEVWPAARPRPVDPTRAPRSLDLAAEGIRTVLLATGFRPDHSWLHLPVLEPGGAIRQYRGVTAAPGVYAVGQRFQHRRDSGFIDGARHDARTVATHLLTGSLPPPARAERAGERHGSAEKGHAA